MNAVSQAADALVAARRARKPLDALPAAPADRAEAYAIMNEVARRLGPVTAWKVGAPGPDAEPTCAPINADTLYFDVPTLPALQFRVIGMEAEIVYRLGRPLPPRDQPYSREDVLEAVASVHPGFEICDTRFVKYGALDPLSHMADQANHGALIVGPAVANWRSLDPTREPLTMDIEGERVINVIGGNSAVDPVRLLTWLANVGSRPFGGLKAGDTVTTGSCTGTIFVEPGSRTIANFANLGTIELTVR